MKNLKRQAIEQRSRARRQLLQTLYQWQISGNDPWNVRRNRLILEKSELNDKKVIYALCGDIDDDYFNAAFDTITEKRDLYDTRVSEHTHRRPSTLDPVERGILWIGMYELIERFDIHPTVTINEAVELAKQFGAADSYKYINATLDKLGKTLRPNG